jgi:translocation and assembly module TamB
MSQGPSKEPNANETGKRRRIWATAGLALGAIAVLGAAGGALWAWIFINEKLSPWASEQLTDTLDRPVYLGDVERVSLTGIRFGQSALPPTEDDPDELVVDSITIQANLLQLLTRTLSPRIILENPVVYVSQNAQGEWLDIDFEDEDEEDEDKEPFIQINPTIEIQSGEVAIQPYLEEPETAIPLAINALNGTVTIAKVDTEDLRNQQSQVKAQEISFDLTAEPENAGSLAIAGVVQQPDYGDEAPPELANALAAKVAIQAQQLNLSTLAPVVLASVPPDLPLTIPSGILNANIDVELQPQEAPRLTGTARLNDGAIAFDAVSTPLTDIGAQARFQGNRVALENVTADYGAMSAQARGFIDTRNGYNLTGTIDPVAITDIAAAFNYEFPVEIDGTLKAEAVKITGSLAKPVVSGRVVSTEVTTIDKVQLATMASQVTYSREGFAFEELEVAPAAGGRLTGEGLFAFAKPAGGQPARFELQLQGRDLPADAIAQAYGLVADDFSIGAVALEADIAGPLNDLSGVVSWDAPGGTYPTRGTAEVAANTVRIRNAELAGGTLSGLGRLVAGQWSADVTAQGLQLGVFNQTLQGVTAGGDVQLAGRTDNFTLRGIRGQGDITAALRGGTLDSRVNLANGLWDADVRTENFPIQPFVPNVPISSLTANAQLSGNVDDFSLEAIQGQGDVIAAIAGGTVVSDVSLANGVWRAEGRGTNVQLRQLSNELQGLADGTFQLAGNVNNWSLTGIQGRANLQLSDGLATAAPMNPALLRARAPLETNLVWDGRQLQIERLETAGLFAQGFVTPRLGGPGAPGIAALDLNLSARDYDLSTLPVNFPPAVGVTGQADFAGRLTGTPNNLTFAGDAALTNLALNDLIFDPRLAGDINFSTAAGLAVSLLGEQDEISVNYIPATRNLDFTVRAGEAIAIGETEGDMLQAQLYNFPISVLNIPPSTSTYGSLRGEIEFANAAINLNTLATTGQFDIQDLGIGFYSVDRLLGSFAYADGMARLTQGEILMADRDERGNITTTRTYELSARYGFNQTPQIQASLATTEGELRDIFEVLKIQELADFRRGFTPNEGFIPDSQAEAEAILATNPVGDPNGTLLNQLRRLSEIMELEIQEELQAEQARIPPLSELHGTFQGTVDLTATIPDDIRAEFDIVGQSWTWGPDIRAEAVIAQGTYTNGLIALSPLQFSSSEEDAYVVLAGEFSMDPEDEQDRLMELEAVNVPTQEFRDLANLPFDLDGRLNATAKLRGQLSAPTLMAELQISDGSLNESPIDDARATLSYMNARVGLDAELLLVGSDDPLTLSAELPYQFAFVEQPPTDNSYAINANVEDEGFALLNLFTNRLIAWESGEGELILNLEGNLDTGLAPTKFDGLILLQGASISSSTLPVPMTDVTGQIRLVPAGLLVVVDRLTGQFSEGQLSAQGTFPLLVPLETLASAGVEGITADPVADPDASAPPADEAETDMAETDMAETDLAEPSANIRSMPLTLDLENIALNLKGLYSGQVNGLMTLGGSLLLGPALSGAIDLSDGTITIPEGNAASEAAEPTVVNNNGTSPIPPFRFEDLRIALTRNINIVQGNLLNVRARGGMRIDGTLDNLRPFGTIQLPSGRVGLFAAALRLAGNNDRAEFRGTFDPILDVTLQTSLPDATPETAGVDLTTSPFPRNEVSDNTINNIGLTQQGNRLVRINARYTGPASELANLTTDSRNLELSSSPSRSDQEIISLLSGNVIGALDALSDGDNALAGIGTFVGSALLSTVRDFLGDTIPLSEFRLFQVQEDTGGVNDSEDIGGEIGFDITSNISVSVLKVLTNDTPFQFNARYRLSDQFTLRGTTSYEDFSDRTGVLLEYETRF